MHDFELWQLEIKTAFLHRELEEKFCMDQPKGFIVHGKEDNVQEIWDTIHRETEKEHG